MTNKQLIEDRYGQKVGIFFQVPEFIKRNILLIFRMLVKSKVLIIFQNFTFFLLFKLIFDILYT